MAENSGVKITYDPTGSGAGIEASSNGSADIGLASRAPKDEEKANGLTETVVALDGIAVIVNAESKVEDLSVEQIAKIFTGEITDWSEVPCQRPRAHGHRLFHRERAEALPPRSRRLTARSTKRSATSKTSVSSSCSSSSRSHATCGRSPRRSR